MAMKPKILVTREVFDETLAFLGAHCEVDSNQVDTPLDADTLAQRLADRQGVIFSLTDRIDHQLLARCPPPKVVANIAVRYNKIHLPACSAPGIKATTTPGG